MFESIASKFVAGVIAVAALTTIFGRSTSAKTFDALGNAGANVIGASLGKGVDLR